MKRKRWQIAPKAPAAYFEALANQGYHPILAQVFFGRGYTDPDSVFDFLGTYEHTDDPFAIKGMDATVSRLLDAIDAGEQIAVYGDFDCDGVTSTVLLTEVLRRLCGNDDPKVRERIRPYIPNRVDEGYGLNSPALKELADKGYNVVVTVDCGIRSVQEVIDGNSYGLDLIISDHHSIGPELPPAYAIINPKQEGCEYPEKGLAGVGLAYKIAQGLYLGAQARGYEGIEAWSPEEWLDLVAIGTVADIAPLKGENRVLVREGLKRLNAPKRIGLRALYGVAGIKAGHVNAITIGFMIGPRINAAGRLRSAYEAAKLLTAQDVQQAGRMAQELNAINVERQQKTRDMQARAEEMMPSIGEMPLLFAAHHQFEQGVVGLVASRLTEQYYRPSVVVQQGEHESHGSCRSIPEFHITDALEHCSDLLERFGGHAAAAGFTVRNENINSLRERLLEVAGDVLEGIELAPSLTIDGEIPLRDCVPQTARALETLEPCGEANRTPTFMSRRVRICEKSRIGAEGKHLKLKVMDDGLLSESGMIEAIAFRLGDEVDNLPSYADVAYTLEFNEWNGQRRIQLNVQDIRPVEE